MNGATLSMPAFIMYFGDTAADGELYLPSMWTSLCSAMTGLAQVFGSFSVGIVMDKIGRKRPVVGMADVSVAGAAIQYIAKAKGTLLAGRMLNGFAIGALLAISTSWSSEVSHY
jgi:MFS family permease